MRKQDTPTKRMAAIHTVRAEPIACRFVGQPDVWRGEAIDRAVVTLRRKKEQRNTHTYFLLLIMLFLLFLVMCLSWQVVVLHRSTEMVRRWRVIRTESTKNLRTNVHLHSRPFRQSDHTTQDTAQR